MKYRIVLLGLLFAASVTNSSLSSSGLAAADGMDDQKTGSPTDTPTDRGKTRADAKPTIHRDLVFNEPAGTTLKADVYVPPGKGPFPGILMVHGGGWAYGDKWQMTANARRAVARGYTVVSMAYRKAPKYKYPAQLEDCQAALRWMRKNAAEHKLDPQRIAGFGYSAGAHLVCLLGLMSDTDQQLKLTAIVAGGAPCDLRFLPERSKGLAYFMGGSRHELPERYREASPITHASSGDPPIFFYHGESDLLVPRSTADALHDRLKELGIKTDFHIVKGKGHVTTFFDEDASRRAIAFLDSVMKPE